MGWNFRKSVRLGKGVRLNFSKSGIGLSAGVKGLRVGVNRRGLYTSSSIPGTGLYRIDYLNKTKKAKDQPEVVANQIRQVLLPKELVTSSSAGCLWTIFSILLLIIQPPLGIMSIILQVIASYRASKKPEKQALKFFQRGNAALADDELEEALNSFLEVVKLVPGTYSVYPVIGDLYREKNDLQQAAKYYKSFLEQDQQDESVKLKLGITLVQDGQYKDAIKVLQGLRAELKEEVLVINSLAASFIGLNEYDLALQVLERGPLLKRKMNEDMKLYRYLLGICYKQLGDKKKAIKQFNKVYAEDVTYLDTETHLKELEGL